MKQSKLSAYWTKLTGDSGNFSIENRAFNAIAVITFIVLLLLLPFNIYLGLQIVSLYMTGLLFGLAFFYYQARIHKRYLMGIRAYAILSYMTLISNFFFNSGSQGPTIYLFFLTFQLLIAFTTLRFHLLWVLLHIGITLALFSIEYFYPQNIPYTYLHLKDRYFDLGSTFVVILTCMYFITIYLRSNYNREKNIAEERAAKIEEQNAQIISQNEELQRLNQEKNKMLSLMGHDLRGPLNSITTVLNFLTNYPVPDEQRKVLKKELLQTTRNASEMLSNLVTWSSDQMNGMQLRIEPVNGLAIIQKVVAVQKMLAATKDITISVQVKDDFIVMADATMLELAFRNIVNNAVKFTNTFGIVSIKVQKKQEHYIICIQDNGIGMEKSQVERLFTMDIHSTYGTNNEKGIGLGLVLSNEFTEMQQGSITVESQKGVGTSFFIRMPAAPGE